MTFFINWFKFPTQYQLYLHRWGSVNKSCAEKMKLCASLNWADYSTDALIRPNTDGIDKDGKKSVMTVEEHVLFAETYK
tara:strand:+ start:304 stop:540 length:237 start_codon:yes stop_codon:yes gene_type:complete